MDMQSTADKHAAAHDAASHDADPAITGALPRRTARKWGRWFLMLGVPLILAGAGFAYWQYARQWAETDNAYVGQDKVSISAEVNGPITEVMVRDGQYVKAGAPLFRIDPAPYEIALHEAEAEIAAAEVDVHSLSTDYRATGVNIGAAREDIGYAEANFERQRALWEQGFTTKASYDAAEHSLTQAREKLRLAQAEAEQAKARLATSATLPGRNPDVAAAMVKREQALLNLKRTLVTAPVAGRIAQVERLQKGQMMITGLPMLTIVKSDESWVDANFKETDLDRMHPGQKATLTFDAYPEIEMKGHVAYIGAGTGSEFSILPAQNATGNWVKVTQRVPVRIAIDGKAKKPLIAGMSAHVSVRLDDED